MRKKFFLIFLFLIIFCFKVNAEDKTLEQQFIDNTGSYLDESITNEAQDYFDENSITLEDSSGISKVSLKQVISYIIGQIKGKLSQPMKLLGVLIAVILLISIVESLSTETAGNSLSKVVDIIGVLICTSVMFKYIAGCIDLTVNTLKSGANFMICYVPIFAGVVGASGSITSAGIYNIAVLSVAEISVQVAVNILLPLMGIFFALSIIEATNPALSLSGLTNGIKKGVQWTLGLIMTLFVGLITIQSIVGVSADTVGIRAAKFVASSFIPVIGGAISDAYSTVKGSLGLLRSGVGTFGIVVLLLTILPPLISVIAFKISISIASFIGEVVGVKKVTLLLKNASSVLSIAISLLTCFALMLIIATTVIMLVGMNLG